MSHKGRRGRRLALAVSCWVLGMLLLASAPPAPDPATARAAEAAPPAYRVWEGPVPPEVAMWRDTYRPYPGLFRLTKGDTTYLLISWGEKRTAGYSLTLNRIRPQGEVMVAEVSLKAPGPEEMVAPVITYPHLLVALPATEALFAAEFEGAPWVPPGEGLPPCSTDFFIDAPAPLATVSSPLRVNGVARVTEGAFRVSIEDGHDALGSATVQASRAAPAWGTFRTDLSFRTPSSPFGHLIFSVQDPRDGKWVEKMGIPVKFGPVTGLDFPDAKNHWAQAAIARAAGRGFVSGYPDGTFRPNADITRAEFMRVLTSTFNLVNTQASSTAGFNHTEGHWAAPYVNAALAAGVLQKADYPEGRFQPDRPVTRLEMVVPLVRALGKAEEAGQAECKEAGRGYRDADLIPDPLKGFVGVATRMGITTGFPDSTFGPQRHATRAEATTMVMRALDTQEAGEAALEFFRCWGQLDLDGMTALMLVPPEKFIPNSDIVFAPFYPKKYPDDVPAFLKASRDLVRQYDAEAWEKATIEGSQVNPTAFAASARIHLRLGQAPYHIWVELQLTDEGGAGWRVRMLDSLPIKGETQAPPSSFSLDRLQPMDVRDLDGQPGAEVLGWAFWGEYEGMGPEPPGARGLFTFRDGELEKLWFTKEGPAPGWVWTGEGVMGHLTSADSTDLLLVRRPAYLDGKPRSQEGPLLGLYRLKPTSPGGQPDPAAPLEKVADVPWPQVAPTGTSVTYGLMAARPLDDTPGDEVVISAFCVPPQGSDYQLVAICRLQGASLRVLASHKSAPGQSLYLTFAPPSAHEPSRSHLYLWTWGGQEITAVNFQDGEFTFTPLPVPYQRLLAAADVDGDGQDEFLLEAPRHRLQLVERDGSVRWETSAYKGIARAWMGLVDGKLTIVMAEPGADANRVVRWEGKREGDKITALEPVWSSPPLGRAHISSLWVADVEGDGSLEIMVSSSDGYLAPADYLHIFTLTSGDLRGGSSALNP